MKTSVSVRRENSLSCRSLCIFPTFMSLTAFTKMHGLGNDFIVLDATHTPFDWPRERIAALADRHTGIGFDQLLIIESARDAHADFAYRIFNSDGGEVEHCGNGARCFAKYVFDHGMAARDKPLRVAVKKGVIDVHYQGSRDGVEQYRVNMGVPDFGFLSATQSDALRQPIHLDGETREYGIVSMGNPHAVTQTADVFAQDALVGSIGRALQHHPLFPQQVNVGFMDILAPDHIRLRVFERGAGETQACGTGACAAVAVGIARGQLQAEVRVSLRGGELRIDWAGGKAPLYMTGAAQTVYRGQL